MGFFALPQTARPFEKNRPNAACCKLTLCEQRDIIY